MPATTDGHDEAAERRTKYHEADVVVVGAGVFGCACAYALAQQGRSVLLLERWMRQPDRIVGELLQPGGVAALRRLGLEACLEGIDAIPCYGYHITYHDDDVVVPYPALDGEGRVEVVERPNVSAAEYTGAGEEGKGKEGPARRRTSGKTPEGRAFHHGRFIMKLRQACLAHRNITVVETEATATIRGQSSAEILGVEARTEDPATGQKRPDYFFGQLTVIADGYASRFRAPLLGADKVPLVRSKFYALELVDCPFPPHGFGHVVIGDGFFPVLLYQIGSRETRALIDVPTGLPAASPARGGVRGYMRDVVAPSLPEAVRPSFLAALDAHGDKIPRSMPNSYLAPTKQAARYSGAVLLGDAFNMRHPLTGGGMTVALHDALLLADLLRPDRVPSLGDTPRVRAALARFQSDRKQLAAIINVLAMALYTLFAARDRQLRALQRGCFAYFQRGFTDEPVALLGGMLPRPFVLAYHFFSVAFLAIWLNACDVVGRRGPLLGLLAVPLALADAVLILWRACVVFVPLGWRELQ